MVNTRMVFYHPNYYKNLRKLARLRNRDQAISSDTATAASERAPGTGQSDSQVVNQVKLSSQSQASSGKLRYTPTGILLGVDLGDKPQASSSKPQAPSSESSKPQASSPKLQASSSKPRASSSKI